MEKGCFIIIDGIDRIGKSTQINLLTNHLKQNNKTILNTRCIGGPQNLPEHAYMQSLRDIVFNNSLPAYAEERVLALASELNLLMIYRLQTKNSYDGFIQDRGLFSHIAYGLAKGHSRNHLEHYYKQVLYHVKFFSNLTINICILPDDFNWFTKRLQVKSETSTRHLELEKINFQKTVYQNMLKEYNLAKKNKSTFINIKNTRLLLVKENDSIEQIHVAILDIINNQKERK